MICCSMIELRVVMTMIEQIQNIPRVDAKIDGTVAKLLVQTTVIPLDLLSDNQ